MLNVDNLSLSRTALAYSLRVSNFNMVSSDQYPTLYKPCTYLFDEVIHMYTDKRCLGEFVSGSLHFPHCTWVDGLIAIRKDY